MLFLRVLLFVFVLSSSLFTMEYHHTLHAEKDTTYEWEVETKEPFDLMLLSWNGSRPSQGSFTFFVRAFVNEWSPSLLYATWGTNFQKSNEADSLEVKVDQDIIRIKDGKKGSRFQVRVVAHDGASLQEISSLHMCAIEKSKIGSKNFEIPKKTIILPVHGICQFALNFVGNNRICSATSTTAVIRYLNHSNTLDPVQFAHKVYDGAYDIFGNWVFNCAQASVELGKEWSVYAEFLESFEPIYASLQKGIPTVISVLVPFQGWELPHHEGFSGHLMAIIGFDTKTQEIIAMDPAMMGKEESGCRYAFKDLFQAWKKRNCMAYMFTTQKLM